MTAEEIWCPIPSLPTYEASSFGRIRKIPTTKPMPRGGVRSYGGVAWTGTWDQEQRRYTMMYKGKTYRVARLVCEAFHGPPPPGRSVAMHTDENSRNNRPDNLAWGTQKENLNAPGFIAYCRSRTGDNNPHVKGKKGERDG